VGRDDQTLVLQQPQCFAQRGAAHLKRFSEVDFDQPFARFEFTGEDGVLERALHLGREGCGFERRQRRLNHLSAPRRLDR